MTAVKESAMDCHIYINDKEPLSCMKSSTMDESVFTYKPSYEKEEKDKATDANRKKITWKARVLKFKGSEYALNTSTNEVYDLNSYKLAIKYPEKIEPKLVGKLVKRDKKVTLQLL